MTGLQCCNSLPVSPILTLTIPSSPLEILYLPLGCLPDSKGRTWCLDSQTRQCLCVPEGEPISSCCSSPCAHSTWTRALSNYRGFSEETMFWADTTCAEGRQIARRERKEFHIKMVSAVNERTAYEKGRQFSVAWISLSC